MHPRRARPLPVSFKALWIWTAAALTFACAPRQRHDDGTGSPSQQADTAGPVAPPDATIMGARDMGSATTDTTSPAPPENKDAQLPATWLDALPADTQTADTAVRMDTASPACAGLLCDDFDDVAAGGLPNAERWTKYVTNDGRTEVSATRAHSGKNSLFVRAPDGSYETFIKTKKIFPLKDNTLFGRMFIWIDGYKQGWRKNNDTWTKDVVHFDFLETRSAKGLGDNRHRVGGITASDPNYGTWLLFNVQGTQSETALTDNASEAGRKRMPVQTWFCLEWMFKGSDPQEAQTWVNGVEATAIHATTQFLTTDWKFPTLAEINIGVGIYQRLAAQDAFDKNQALQLWIDDVVLSGTRVGCGAP